MARRSRLALAALLVACGVPVPAHDAGTDVGRDAFRAPIDAYFGDTNAADTGACATRPTFSDVLPIFTASCALAPCHSHGSADPGAGLVFDTPTARQDIVGNTTFFVTGGYLVIPGDPGHSFLWRKITNQIATNEGRPMPDPGTGPWMELPADQRELIRCWIAAGAN